MKIQSGRLYGVPFVSARVSGGAMTPTLIVLHDTAGRLTPKSSVEWFQAEDCTASAHIVVERDGSITQMVPFDKKAWHAGHSSWKGREFCNAFSVGIEIVNPGKLDAKGRAWFHKPTEAGFPVSGLKRLKTAEHGDGYWMPYTPEQIEAVTEVCKALCKTYDIEDITTHWAISPKRKIDTNPLFPLDEVRKAALAADAEGAPAIEPAEPTLAIEPATTAKELKEQGSGSMSSIDRLAKWLGLPTLGAFGLTVSDFMGAFKGTLDGLKNMAADHAAVLIFMGLGFSGGLVCVALYAKHRLLLAAKEGRYQPRGS